jgi:hypothetical protein
MSVIYNRLLMFNTYEFWQSPEAQGTFSFFSQSPETFLGRDRFNAPPAHQILQLQPQTQPQPQVKPQAEPEPQVLSQAVLSQSPAVSFFDAPILPPPQTKDREALAGDLRIPDHLQHPVLKAVLQRVVLIAVARAKVLEARVLVDAAAAQRVLEDVQVLFKQARAVLEEAQQKKERVHSERAAVASPFSVLEEAQRLLRETRLVTQGARAVIDEADARTLQAPKPDSLEASQQPKRKKKPTAPVQTAAPVATAQKKSISYAAVLLSEPSTLCRTPRVPSSSSSALPTILSDRDFFLRPIPAKSERDKKLNYYVMRADLISQGHSFQKHASQIEKALGGGTRVDIDMMKLVVFNGLRYATIMREHDGAQGCHTQFFGCKYLVVVLNKIPARALSHYEFGTVFSLDNPHDSVDDKVIRMCRKCCYEKRK